MQRNKLDSDITTYWCQKPKPKSCAELEHPLPERKEKKRKEERRREKREERKRKGKEKKRDGRGRRKGRGGKEKMRKKVFLRKTQRKAQK